VRRQLVSIRLAPVIVLMPAQFLRRNPRRGIQFPMTLSATGQALVVLLDRRCGTDESCL